MSIATRKGDQGQTDLLFGCRLTKSHPRVHALGAVDELNAALGPLRIAALRAETREIVPQVQRWLIELMGELATPPGEEARYVATHPEHISSKHVLWLDEWVANLEAGGALKFKGWALPGEAGVMSGAYADLARVACRRAERNVIDLLGTPDEAPNAELIRFLNRLSDVLWLLARWEEQSAATE
ncbi:cob(I)yrinic acid a,c-diamide adenosyltransferase [Prosthecobacter vanneervenii]|uniref:Corrinoid adenosyltransferase n=1 Tax=Prosthecobacter vanneervenii TaxID=48466 RepID=A0A7W8DJ26_9BACT|nr:cob(I)yrinic acid a,c-diamide adenosyltransferase [Prosthecobacter vanneervenii]MBB5031652.1 cob(I)alamin adenosyltransferase [Prosthecobacter vanneervenii]